MAKRKPWMMKKYKSRARMDTRRAPRWWPSRPDQAEALFKSLRGVKTFELSRSAGGRPIIGATWGKREDLPKKTCASLASALAGGSSPAFYGKGERKRRGFMFLGAAHGMEIEGSVAALNFLNVVVTGKDLRGRRWPRMAKAGRQLRIVIVPFFNTDGRERYHESRQFVGVDPDERRCISQGNWKSGEKLKWPGCKLHFPIPVDKVDPLGAYFNDNGVNLVYDTPFGREPQPETRAFMEFLRREMPDCVLCSHTDNGSLVQPPDSFVPRRFRQRQLQIGAVAGARCRREGMQKSNITNRQESYAGEIFYQTDLIYHTCGALPLLVEFPCGYQNVPDNPGEILDTGMYVLEEIVCFGVEYGFRPPEPK